MRLSTVIIHLVIIISKCEAIRTSASIVSTRLQMTSQLSLHSIELPQSKSKGQLQQTLRRPMIRIEDNIDKIKEAVKLYRQVNGIKINELINIPYQYRIPSTDPYPEYLWDFNLGSVCHCIKYYRRKKGGDGLIDELHLQPPNVNRKKFELFIEGLITYKNIYGDTLVPRSFRIPNNHPLWSDELWGLKLGTIVASVRARRSFNCNECHQRLQDIGFIWSPLEHKQDLIYLALESYKTIVGHLDVPQLFEVPHADPWPPCCWGLKIGHRLSNVRYRGDGGSALRGAIQNIGVDLEYSGFDLRHWEFVYSALQLHKKIFGHVQVHIKWIVPDEEPWPEELWGLKLGYRVNNIRYRGDFIRERPAYKMLLDDLGFVWKSDRRSKKFSKRRDEDKLIDNNGNVYSMH